MGRQPGGMRDSMGKILRRAAWWASLVGLVGCDDAPAADAGPPVVDAAPSTAPPPAPLSGLFHLRIEQTGGDCPDGVLAVGQTVALAEANGQLAFQRRGVAFTGTRTGGTLAATGAGETEAGGCTVREASTWAGRVQRPGNAFTVEGESTFTPVGACAQAACTAQWVGRAGRVGGVGPSGYRSLALDPSDEAVEAAAEFRGAAWFATASAAGGRLWRLVNDVGVPSLTAAISAGFHSENAALAGNNHAIRSLLATPDALYAGTWDDPAGDPPGNGFDLWAFDGMAWTALVTDGVGDPAREAVDALAALDGDLYLGVRNAGGAEVWRRTAAGAFQAVYPVPGATDAAHGPGPADPRACATEVTSMVVHEGQLYVALGGADCAAGAFVLRLEDPQVPEWTLVSEGGLGDARRRTVSLASDGTELFALASGAAVALLRHAGGRHWVTVADDGFGDATARQGAHVLGAPARDFLFFPVDGAGGGTLWTTTGGAEPRDLMRIAAGDPLHPGVGLGPTLAFEERIFIGTVGQPATLLRATTRLAEQGAGTVRTAHDAVDTASRGSGTACHRAGTFFNPVLQADQPLRVVLPPNVAPEDNVLLPAIYLLPPDLGAPGPGEGAGNPVRERLNAWLDAAAATHAPLLGCLAGRPGTIPCQAGEAERACLQRCLVERVPTLVEDAGRYAVGPAMTPEQADALITSLGAPVALPMTERFALVLVGLGAGYAIDAPAEAPWAPELPGRDDDGVLWPGEVGAYASALAAAVEEVDRCWPASVRADPSARSLLGHGLGAFSALQVLLARDDMFNGAIARNGHFSLDRLIADRVGRVLLASIPEVFRGVAAGTIAPVFLVGGEDDPCGACETRALCEAMAAASQAGVAFAAPTADPVQALAPAVFALSELHRQRRPGPITCDALPAGDCGACPTP